MKKMLILAAIVSLVAGSLFAEEAVLIDFGKLAADVYVDRYPEDPGPGPGEPEFNQNSHTMMDYSNRRFGGSFREEDKNVMKTSLAIANWEVLLGSSSRTVTNMVLSRTKEAESKGRWGGKTIVMGVRIHFPVENYHSSAIIKPPFEIPAFEPMEGEEDDPSAGINTPSRFEDGYGVIKNVGTIKAIAVNVYGLNFPHGLNTILIDGVGNQKVMFMGYLNFDGWGELRWDNPAYVQEIRNRDLRLYPLYPESTPFLKFAGFEIKRDGSRQGGDFITYFKDVKVIYDKAVLEIERDIEDEALWHIIQDRETARKVWEMERFGQNQVLRYLDAQRQATESTFTPTSADDETGGGGRAARQQQEQ